MCGFVHIQNKKHTPEIVISANSGVEAIYFIKGRVICSTRAAISWGSCRKPL